VQEVVSEEVEKRKEQIRCVLCLGHNKGMEEAATSLAVSGLPSRHVRIREAVTALICSG
jgi:phosphohistidine phosphatase SixA